MCNLCGDEKSKYECGCFKTAENLYQAYFQRVVGCPKCLGEGWLWWDELQHYSGQAVDTGQDNTRYTCDMCDGHKMLGVLKVEDSDE